MPFNAVYAFMQAGRNGRYSQKTRSSSAKVATYPSTSGYGQLISPVGWITRSRKLIALVEKLTGIHGKIVIISQYRIFECLLIKLSVQSIKSAPCVVNFAFAFNMELPIET